jgi:protein-S-isoprenylcysteine O-methyltransferase Ste14
MESWGKIAQKLRVPLGTVLGLVFLIFMHPSYQSLWLGGIVAFLGGILRIWAAGHIEKGRVLAQGGPYALTRNPLYLGSFLMALGILIAGQGYWLLLPFGLFFLAVYYPVMKAEEQELLQGYGENFMQYCRRVPLFLPTLRFVSGPPSIFLWSRVLKNREHKTFAVLVLTVTILIIKGIIQ